MQWILASQSPRRRELFALFHLPFEVRVADVDETMSPEKGAYDEVARVSRLKALAHVCGSLLYVRLLRSLPTVVCVWAFG